MKSAYICITNKTKILAPSESMSASCLASARRCDETDEFQKSPGFSIQTLNLVSFVRENAPKRSSVMPVRQQQLSEQKSWACDFFRLVRFNGLAAW